MIQNMFRQPFTRLIVRASNSSCRIYNISSSSSSSSHCSSTNKSISFAGLNNGISFSVREFSGASEAAVPKTADKKKDKSAVTTGTAATTIAQTSTGTGSGTATAAAVPTSSNVAVDKKIGDSAAKKEKVVEKKTSEDKSGKGFGKNLKRKKIVRTLKVPIAEEPHNIYHAIDLMRKNAYAGFNETIDLAINLGVDPRKPNQAIKGVCQLPNGNGKKVRVAVFANGSDAQAAVSAGAEVVGAEDLVKAVMDGEINFDRVIATPEMMPLISKIGKILGPKGLMPNPKMGTVTKDILRAVKTVKAGSVQFKVDKTSIVHAGIGKLSFSDDQLIENIRSFMLALGDTRPEGFKSKYILSCSMSSTMGPGVRLDVANLDPTSPKFMMHFNDL